METASRSKAIADIRAKCTEANPEITELKMGCRVRDQHGIAVLIRNYKHFNGDTYEGKNERGLTVITQFQEIIGRSIRLADVLLAIHAVEPKKRPMYFSAGCDGAFYESKYTYPDGNRCVIEHNGLGGIGVGWYLDRDDLEQQSDETIEFIHSLLTPASTTLAA